VRAGSAYYLNDSADSEHSSDLLMMTQLALTATAEVIRMRAMALSVFALLRAQQVTNNNGLLSPIADACAQVVHTISKMTATAEVIRMRAMALSVFALLRAQQVTNNNGLLSPMRARR